MTITVSVPDQLVEQAAQQGLSPEAYVDQLFQQELKRRREPKWTRFGPGPLTPQEAGRDLRRLRQGVKLGGLKLKDLVHAGHKY
ncbi:MAG: hypothetical protein JO182_05785 [Acidobacteriaceae bacterium]|nr:hypothetical protein [Acidobacteriaceae bacterium]MBV9033985.1 hypothetical protein [Acidobacteriaceae bacterium]MBV9306196.1 hypothetical protein [Acidobacteriaceae bacterium]